MIPERRKQDWSSRDRGNWGDWKPSKYPAGEPNLVTVIFRKFKDNDIIAVFPGISEGPGLHLSYMHVGQHGAASRSVVWKNTVPATLQEYRKLAYELEEQVGYKLKPVRRWPD